MHSFLLSATSIATTSLLFCSTFPILNVNAQGGNQAWGNDHTMWDHVGRPVDQFGHNIGNTFSDFGRNVNDNFEQFGRDANDGLNRFGNNVRDDFNDFGNHVRGGFEDAGHGIKHAVDTTGNAIDHAAHDVRDGFRQAGDGIKHAADKVGSFFSDTFHRTRDEVHDHSHTLKGVAAGVGTGLAVGIFNPIAGVVAGTTVGLGVRAHEKHQRDELIRQEILHPTARNVENHQRNAAFGFVPPQPMPVFGSVPSNANMLNDPAFVTPGTAGAFAAANRHNNWSNLRPEDGHQSRGIASGSAIFESRTDGVQILH